MIDIPVLFRQQFSSPSGGDAYLVPTFCQVDPNNSSRSVRTFRASGPNEIPIYGGRRVTNLFPASMMTTNLTGIVLFTSSGYAAAGLDQPTLEPWVGPSGKPNTAIRARGPVHGQCNWMFYRGSVLGPGSVNSRRIATSCYAKAGPDHTTGLISGIIIYNHQGPSVYTSSFDAEWRRYSALAGPVTFPGGDIRWSVGVGAAAVDSGKICDVIISLDPDFPYQVEDLTGATTSYGCCSEPVNPLIDYGFGVPGVRWFDYTNPCTRDFMTGRVTEIASPALIPDVEGLRPQFAATNMYLYSSPWKTGSIAQFSTMSGLVHASSKMSQFGDLFWDRFQCVAESPTVVPQAARGGMNVPGSARVSMWTIARCVSPAFPWIAQQIAWVGPLGSLYNVSAAFNLVTGQGSIHVEYFPAETIGSFTMTHLGNSIWLCALLAWSPGSAALTCYNKMGNASGSILHAVESGALMDFAHFQMEASVMPTLPIVTSGAAGSRLADSFAINSIYVGSTWVGFCEVYYPPEGITPEVRTQAWNRIWGTVNQEVGAVILRSSGQAGHANLLGTADVRTPAGVVRIVNKQINGLLKTWANGVMTGPASIGVTVGAKQIGLPAAAGVHSGIGLRRFRLWIDDDVPDELCAALSRGEVLPP